MQRSRRTSLPPATRALAAGPCREADVPAVDLDPLDWSWPPYAPIEPVGTHFDTPDWAPASTVRHPLVRVGRWTVLYRRAA